MFPDLTLDLKAVLGLLRQRVVRVCENLLPFYATNYLNWIFLSSTFVLALGWYLFCRPRGTQRSFEGFRRFLLPKGIFLHPSAVLDYKFYLVNGLLIRLLRIGELAAAMLAPLFVADSIRRIFESAFGENTRMAAPGLGGQVCFTILLFLVVDFAKFYSHFLFHHIAFLWEFHKVHHAAEVLTPITNGRIHPAEYLVTQLLEVLAVGSVSGCFGYFYPSGIARLTILNFGFIQFFYYLYGNLRHSHIPLGFGRVISPVLCSPVMHQLHHSADPRHRNKNFSFTFSVWDTLAGTLYVPKRGERFPIGLDEEDVRFQTLWSLYVRPFKAASLLLLPKIAR